MGYFLVALVVIASASMSFASTCKEHFKVASSVQLTWDRIPSDPSIYKPRAAKRARALLAERLELKESAEDVIFELAFLREVTRLDRGEYNNANSLWHINYFYGLFQAAFSTVPNHRSLPAGTKLSPLLARDQLVDAPVDPQVVRSGPFVYERPVNYETTLHPEYARAMGLEPTGRRNTFREPITGWFYYFDPVAHTFYKSSYRP